MGSPFLRKDRGLNNLTQEKLPMSTDTTVSPLRQRMIEDMAARKLGRLSQRSHIYSCKRFAAFLKRSRSPGPSRCCAIFRAIPIASPSPIAAWSRPTTRRHLQLDGLPDRRRSGRDVEDMTLSTDEFIRRFLLHVLPKGFHRIRHYGLFANGNRAVNIARARDAARCGTPTSLSPGSAQPTTIEPPCCRAHVPAVAAACS